jgi:2-keto-3-deoxy-L-rhamnonate aldolase RhmA
VEGNRFRQLFLSGKFAAGTMLFLPSEVMVDVVGWAGFDYVMFDQEHASYDVACIERLVRAAEAHDLPSLARLAGPDPILIQRVLDTGVDALMFSRVKSAAEAEEIVALTRLAPLGKRGACPGSRSAHYFFLDKDEYTRRANDVAVTLMIETKEALAEIDAILAVPGIDGVVVGKSDLAYSLGVDRDGPEVAEAQARVMELAREAGVGMMVHVRDAEDIVPWLEQPDGPRVFWYSVDLRQIYGHFDRLIKQSRAFAQEHLGETASAVSSAGL